MLQDLGWSEQLQQTFTPHAALGLIPGRVTAQDRGRLTLATDAGETAAETAGRLAYDAAPGELPCVGDFVAAQPPAGGGPAIVRAVLPRRGAFTRRSPEGEVQVVAANVDVAFIAMAIDAAPNLRRLERYLTAAWASGAIPCVLLTKADACDEPAAVVAAVRRVAAGAEIVALSAITGEGLAAVRERIEPGATAVLVGASGAGKSTLVNALLGEARLATAEVRADDRRGRHTTTRRELFRLPEGGLIIDTPGLRALALDDAGDGLSATFDDIDALAERCHFRDCSHDTEPGCAVRAAREAGDLDDGRWASFVKLRKEIAHQARQDDPLLREQTRRKWVAINRANRARARGIGRG